jgi:hypothetical protein
MLMSLSSFQISALLVASWTLSLLLQDVVAGIAFAFMVDLLRFPLVG